MEGIPKFVHGSGSVLPDDSGHKTAEYLNSKRMRGNLEREQVLSLLRHITRENDGLGGSTVNKKHVRIGVAI